MGILRDFLEQTYEHGKKAMHGGWDAATARYENVNWSSFDPSTYRFTGVLEPLQAFWEGIQIPDLPPHQIPQYYLDSFLSLATEWMSTTYGYLPIQGLYDAALNASVNTLSSEYLLLQDAKRYPVRTGLIIGGGIAGGVFGASVGGVRGASYGYKIGQQFTATMFDIFSPYQNPSRDGGSVYFKSYGEYRNTHSWAETAWRNIGMSEKDPTYQAGVDYLKDSFFDKFPVNPRHRRPRRGRKQESRSRDRTNRSTKPRRSGDPLRPF